MDEKQKVEQRSFIRIAQLERCPIAGIFDREHLLQIHHFIFQDSPDALPGQFRPGTASWAKCRALETENLSYLVPYYRQNDLAQRLDAVCHRLAQAQYLQHLALAQFADQLAEFYADFDYLHPFADGNSRTLRTFTRQLANNAGVTLDWGTGAGDAAQRDLLYKARDMAVLRRAWPGLSRAHADALPDTPDSRDEYEAYYLALKLIEDSAPLSELIRKGISPTGKPLLRLIK